MLAEYTAIRAYIVTAIQTAWAGVTVVKTQDALERPGQFVLLQLDGDQEIGGHSPTFDEQEFNFTIVGRFTLANSADPELEAITKAASLRTQLLVAKNPGSVGYMPMVTRYSLDPQSAGDNRYDVSLTFRCMATVSRA